MKKVIFAIMLILPITLIAQNKSSYTIKGKVGSFNAPAKVYLVSTNASVPIADSAVMRNGQFEFKGTIIDPIQANLILSYTGNGQHSQPNQEFPIYLESGQIDISSPDSLVNATVKGAQVNADYEKLKNVLKPSLKKVAAFTAEYNAISAKDKENKEIAADAYTRYNAIIAELYKVLLDFVKVNPNSYISLDALKQVAGDAPDYAVVAPLFNSFSSEVKNTVAGKEYAQLLEATKTTAIGSMASDFVQNDPNGKPIRLSDFKGKYVLIDFWASWCGPCRAENPNVVNAYNKYHDKGLEILGVSLDDEKSKAAWLAAIKKDGLIWKNVSDLKGPNNEVAKQYVVKAIPQNFLLDKTGKIIATNLRGEDLDKKLGEIFN